MTNAQNTNTMKTQREENVVSQFQVGTTYEGSGHCGDVEGVITSRTAKFVTIQTAIPTPFRVKINHDAEGEVIYFGAWCIRSKNEMKTNL